VETKHRRKAKWPSNNETDDEAYANKRYFSNLGLFKVMFICQSPIQDLEIRTS
jgi:hypothetical protein